MSLEPKSNTAEKSGTVDRPRPFKDKYGYLALPGGSKNFKFCRECGLKIPGDKRALKTHYGRHPKA